MQFDGPGAANLSMDDRMTIANMAIEAGGKNGIFEFDSRTAEYVDARVKLNGTKPTYEPVTPDKDSKFLYELVVDLDQLEPVVACHPDPGQRKTAKEMGHIKARPRLCGFMHGRQDERFCGGRARCLRGRRATIDTFGVPATPEVVHELQSTRWGNKTIWQILEDAGVRMTENAGCAACLGGPVDTFGRINQPGLKCISATNRNFPQSAQLRHRHRRREETCDSLSPIGPGKFRFVALIHLRPGWLMRAERVHRPAEARAQAGVFRHAHAGASRICQIVLLPQRVGLQFVHYLRRRRHAERVDRRAPAAQHARGLPQNRSSCRPCMNPHKRGRA